MWACRSLDSATFFQDSLQPVKMAVTVTNQDSIECHWLLKAHFKP